MKYFRTMLTICSLVIVVIACSTSTTNMRNKDSGVEYMQDAVTIKAGGSYEECIELQPGQVFDYDYDASDFVNFNIHYHAADKVHYPASRKGRMMGKGMIDPQAHAYYTEEQEFYCLMWENKNSRPVKVSFSCVLRDQ